MDETLGASSTTESAPALPALGDRLLSTREAAGVLGLSHRTLEDLRWKGSGPRYLSLSRNCVRYLHRDLMAWAEEKARLNTSHPSPAQCSLRRPH